MPRKMMDRTGSRFGRLVVLSFSHDQRGSKYWLCRCDCGAERNISFSNLANGRTLSCGCLQAEVKKLPRERKTSGPRVRTPEYMSWCSMRARCFNKNCNSYPSYGGRGITVDPTWDSFSAFLDDMGTKPGPSYSLDRIDNDGNYTPKNCRWATPEEQAQNRRTSIKINGVSLSKHCRDNGISAAAVAARLKRGWSLPDALTSKR